MFGVEEVVSGAELLIVALAALLGSTITAIAGLGGGILLLSVLLQFLDPLEAIPVHAVIQLASNSSRALILRRDVDWGIVARFSLFLLPSGAIGLLVATAFPVNLGRIFIAVFALALVWWPQGLTKISSFLGGGRRSFVPLGAVAGFLNIPFGVTGPAIAPMFRRELPVRTAMVATFAMAQTFGHLAKIVLFAGDGFAYGNQLSLMVVGAASVVAGTWFGTRVLKRLSEVFFGHLFRIALTLITLRVLLVAVLD
ncbi:MAG: sulfite exporter TauE/SafE family protein [Actinomycetota bacterium]|nr:sulfite exporter TauE/SafE family protein [Actinomycetota bacterium]